MNNWERVCIEDVCESVVDCINKTAPIIDEPSPFKMIRTTNIRNGRLNLESVRCVTEETYSQWTRRQIPKRGDILLTREAPTGEVGMLLTDDHVFLGQRIVSCRTNPELLNNKFLLYAFQSDDLQNQIKAFASGSTVQHMRVPDTKALQIPLPPLHEQKRIVAIVDEAFEGIDRAIANTQKNLTNARELFESYLNAIFTQSSEEWKEVELGALSERITKGSSPKWQGINYVDEPGILFVTSENVGQNRMLFEKTKYVEEAFNEKDSKSILSFGDVLTNIVGASIGRTAIYDRKELANINQAVCLIRCKPDKLFNKYLSYLLNSPYFRQILHDNEINNARANLSLTFFRELQIPLPSLEEQRSIVSGIDELHIEIYRLETIYQQKLAAFNELKQSILRKAFTGELTADTANQTTKAAKEVIAA